MVWRFSSTVSISHIEEILVDKVESLGQTEVAVVTGRLPQ
jgi:hypothetical protein